MARMFSCRLDMMEGVLVRMLIPSEAEVASKAGMAAEKTKDVPLIRWCSVTIRDAAQKPPPEQREFAIEPTIMSTEEAGTL